MTLSVVQGLVAANALGCLTHEDAAIRSVVLNWARSLNQRPLAGIEETTFDDSLVLQIPHQRIQQFLVRLLLRVKEGAGLLSEVDHRQHPVNIADVDGNHQQVVGKYVDASSPTRSRCYPLSLQGHDEIVRQNEASWKIAEAKAALGNQLQVSINYHVVQQSIAVEGVYVVLTDVFHESGSKCGAHIKFLKTKKTLKNIF